MADKSDALRYHEQGRPGKIEVSTTKALATQRDLSLAYTPGVAEACRAIHAQPDDVFSFAVNKSSRAAGWFQHLPKFWEERTEAAGIPGASIADPVAQLKVAAYLLYETPQGRGHWMQSQACWG